VKDETNPPFAVSPERSSLDESRLGALSVRGLIALLVVVTICAMSFLVLKVEEPLYTLSSLTVGYYFGQSQQGRARRQNEKGNQ